MNSGQHISQEDMALQAMHALPFEEAVVTATHVAECAECRAELAELLGDLAWLSLSVEQRPVPLGSRERFLHRLHAPNPEAKAPPPVPIAAAHTGSTAAIWLGWLAAAAMALLAVSLAVRVNQLKQKLHTQTENIATMAGESAQARQVFELLHAPAAQHVLLTAAKVKSEPSGRAIYLADRGALFFQGSGLKPLTKDWTYELWLIPANGGAPIPAGLFCPDATGSAEVVLPPLPKGVAAKAFGVTVEKAEGSATPTAPILLAGTAANPGE
jgi:hypothetical protein